MIMARRFVLPGASGAFGGMLSLIMASSKADLGIFFTSGHVVEEDNGLVFVDQLGEE